MENLEDAVALFSPRGDMIFSNAAMRALLPDSPGRHPCRPRAAGATSGARSWSSATLAGAAVAGARSRSRAAPERAEGGVGSGGRTERLLMCHAIEDTNRRFLGAMLVARNVGYLNQVHSTLNYSRKPAALGRLLAGVAHEVKNPLNAMTIHLELLKQKLGPMSEPIVVPARQRRTRAQRST